jgi:hypothetical protein
MDCRELENAGCPFIREMAYLERQREEQQSFLWMRMA